MKKRAKKTASKGSLRVRDRERLAGDTAAYFAGLSAKARRAEKAFEDALDDLADEVDFEAGSSNR